MVALEIKIKFIGIPDEPEARPQANGHWQLCDVIADPAIQGTTVNIPVGSMYYDIDSTRIWEYATSTT
jgi:predicted glycosyltransferase